MMTTQCSPHPEVPALLRASKDTLEVRALRGSQGLAPQGEEVWLLQKAPIALRALPQQSWGRTYCKDLPQLVGGVPRRGEGGL